MKLSKNILSALAPLSLIALSTSLAIADQFIMKDGTTINGSIIKETHSNYLLRAEISNNVYGEKTISKDDVESVIKTDLSIAAFEKISSILPTKDMMSTDAYQNIITTKVEPFIKDYPDSSHIEDAQEILKTLNDEYSTIKNGGIKINKKLLTAKEIDADRYDIQAAIDYHTFIGYAKKKHYRAALSTLENLENNYPDSEQCRKAQQAALTILPRYEAKLQTVLENVEPLALKRKIALESMSPGDKTRTSKIFEQEEQQYKTLLEQMAENKKKIKWLPINAYFKDPIEKNLKMIPTESKRISSLVEKPTVDIGSIYRDTYSAIEAGDYHSAKESYDNFKKSKPPEELLATLNERLEESKRVMELMAQQEKQAEELAKQQAEEEKARLKNEKKESKSNTAEKKSSVTDKIKKKKDLLDKIPQ